MMSQDFVKPDGRLTTSGQKLLAVAITLCELVGSEVVLSAEKDNPFERQDDDHPAGDNLRWIYDLTLLVSLSLIWLVRSQKLASSVNHWEVLKRCLAVADWNRLDRFLESAAPLLADLVNVTSHLLQTQNLKLDCLTCADLGYVYEALISYEPQITEGMLTNIMVRGGSVAISHKSVRSRQGCVRDRGSGSESLVEVIKSSARSISILRPHRFALNRQASSQFLKRKGTFFTPPHVVDCIVARSFEIFFKSEDGKIPRSIPAPRVLDPAMGAGHFLLAVIDYLSKRWAQRSSVKGGNEKQAEADTDFRKAIAERCIYGIDVDYGAVRMARLLTLLHAGFAPSLVKALKRNLVQGDVLHSSYGVGSFVEIHFPHLVAESRTRGEGFDLVLSNPPYLSYSGRERKGKPDEGRKLREQHRLGGWLSSHGIFMVRAAEIVNKAGVVSMIVPDQVGYLEGYRHVRRRLLELGELVEVRYWGEDVFARAKTPVMTFCLRKQPTQRQRAIYIRHRTVTDLDPEEGSWCVAPYSDLLRIVSARHRPIGGYFDIGVHTGNVASRIVLGEPIDGSVRVLEGKQVHRFWCEAPRKWLNLKYRAKRGEYFRIAPSRVYETIDIVLRQTASYPIAARHVHRCHFRNSVLGLRVPHGFSVEYLLGILNSQICHLLFAALSPETHQRTFPQVKIGKLKKLPIPDPRAPGKKRLVRQIESLVRRLEHEAPTLEKDLLDELNSVVCEIYEVGPYVVSSLADHLPG